MTLHNIDDMLKELFELKKQKNEMIKQMDRISTLLARIDDKEEQILESIQEIMEQK